MGPLPPDIGIANSECIDSRNVHPIPGVSPPREFRRRPETGAVENCLTRLTVDVRMQAKRGLRMPELPEVVTLRRQLGPLLTGETIRGLEILDEKLRGIRNPAGKTIQALSRRGKSLEFHLDGGETLALHLRMSGRLRWLTGPGVFPHTRFWFAFDAGRLIGIDSRRFATPEPPRARCRPRSRSVAIHPRRDIDGPRRRVAPPSNPSC